MSLKYLFIDMNSYFASVEQQLDPKLRGKPVVVAPVKAETTSCIAASYEAKKFGIRTGTRIAEARQLCKDLIVVPARSKEYVEIHHQIYEAVDSVVPVNSVLSIDEMVCRLWGDHTQPDRALEVARRIKKNIASNVGECLTSSIGIAPNKLLAKVASDMQKPNGLVILPKESLPGSLEKLKLTDFSGIGPRMEKRFLLAGVPSVTHLLQLDIKRLSRIWGSKLLGASWYYRLRGEDVPDTKTQRRSLGHSKVLSPQNRNDREARAILIRLIHKAAARLRHMDYKTRSLTLSISYLGREKWRISLRIEPCCDTLSLINQIMEMWDERPRDGSPLKVGIVFNELVKPGNIARSLFDDESNSKHEKVSRAMDAANKAFGRYAVYYGGMHGHSDTTHSTRITFNVIPDLKLTDA